jgi:hypothetical protein
MIGQDHDFPSLILQPRGLVLQAEQLPTRFPLGRQARQMNLAFLQMNEKQHKIIDQSARRADLLRLKSQSHKLQRFDAPLHGRELSPDCSRLIPTREVRHAGNAEIIHPNHLSKPSSLSS